MTAREFFDAVVEMRKHQIQSFRYHGQDTIAVRKAKEAESRVDIEIARVQLLEQKRRQQSFDFEGNT